MVNRKEELRGGDTGVVFGNVPLLMRQTLRAWDSKMEKDQGHVYLD